MIGDLKDYHHSRDFFERRVPWVFSGFLVILLAVLTAAVAWAAWGELDVVVKAPALLRPDRNISSLKNAVAGPLALKTYAQGQQVHQGDLLWRVDTTSLEVDRANTALQEHRAEERARTLAVYEQAVFADRNTVPATEREAQTRAAVYFAETSRLTLTWAKAEQTWQRERDLPASMTTRQKIQDLETEAQLAKIALESYRAQERLRVQDERTAVAAEREGLAKHRAELDRARADAEVRAPLDGTIEELRKVNVGDYLLVGEEVARLVPAGAERLKLELTVDNRDIAEVRSGMAVTVRFTSLAPSEYGQLRARVTSVPADATSNSTSMVFLVQATVDTPWLVNRRGERVDLKPGMSAEARILIKRKPIWRFLLEKLDFLS